MSNPEMTANDWIEKLGLLPHPEGGFYRETFRAPEEMAVDSLPSRFLGNRSFSTAIYYLVRQNDFSAFHRLKADEVWHHYEGGNFRVITIDHKGNRKDFLVGKEGEAYPQAVVYAGFWIAAFLEPGSDFGLAGCTVAPGFDFADFEMGNRELLTQQFPAHKDIFQKYCR